MLGYIILPENWKIHDTFHDHVSQLAEYHSSVSYQPPPPAQLLEGELEYEVDCIVDHRIKSPSAKGRPSSEYLVQWTGMDSDLYTWEPERNLKNSSQTVLRYWDNLQAQGVKVPWSKPKFVSAVEVAQRRGRIEEASLASGAVSTRRPIPKSLKRRLRRKKGLTRPGPVPQALDL